MERGFGRIELILGPMFANKSTEMLKRIRMHRFAQRKCVVVKPDMDTRYCMKDSEDGKVITTYCTTHDGQRCEAISCTNLLDVIDILRAHDAIGIDEGQFFPDIDIVCDILAMENKIVIVWVF